MDSCCSQPASVNHHIHYDSLKLRNSPAILSLPLPGNDYNHPATYRCQNHHPTEYIHHAARLQAMFHNPQTIGYCVSHTPWQHLTLLPDWLPRHASSTPTHKSLLLFHHQNIHVKTPYIYPLFFTSHFVFLRINPSTL